MHITPSRESAAGWEQSDLARASGLPLSSLRRLERWSAGLLSAHARTVEAVRMALEPAGVEFTNGDAPGVKPVRRMK
jgi:hypothetical protein